MLKYRILLLALINLIGFNGFAQNVKLVLPSGHLDKISDVNFSLDEQMMASASEDNSVKIWSTVNGKLLQELKGHTDEVFKVFFYPDSKKVLTASSDRTIKIWNIFTGESFAEYSIPEGIQNRNIFLTRDGKKSIIVSPNRIITLDAETGKEISVIENSIMSGFAAVGLSNDQNRIVLSDNHMNAPELRVWDLKTKKDFPIDVGSYNNISQVRFYNDSLIISHNLGNHLYISNYLTGITRKIEFRENIEKFFLNPADQQIVTLFKNGKMFSGSLPDYEKVDLFLGKKGEYRDIKYNSATKNYIFLTGKKSDFYDSSFQFQLGSGNIPSFNQLAFPDKMTNMFFSGNGKYLAIPTDDGKIRLQNAITGESLFTLSNHLEVVTGMYCIKNDIILTGDEFGYLKKWEIRSGKMTVARKLSEQWIEAIDYTLHDSLIAVGTGSGGIHILRLNDFSPVANFSIENSFVVSCAFSQDGKYVAGTIQNLETGVRNVIIWEIRSRREILSKTGFFYKGNSPFVANSSQVLFADSDDRSLNLFDYKTGRQVRKLKTNFTIQNFSVSADGSLLCASSNEDLVKWWNVKDLQQMGQAKKIGSEFTDAQFSPDNKLIVTNAYDGAVDVWEVNSGKRLGRVNTGFGFNRLKFISPKKLIVESNQVVSIFDIDKMSLDSIASGAWLQQWQNQAWFENIESVVTLGNGSSFSFYPIHGKARPTVFCNIDSLDYLTLLPDGYYLASPKASKLLHYVTPELKVITFDQLDVKYNRPDKVLESLGKSDPVLVNSFKQAYHKRVKKLGIDTSAFTEAISMPEAEFLNRAEISYEQTASSLKLRIRGSDKSSQLDRFQVWINETPLFGMKGIRLDQRAINNFDTSLTIPLSAGLNVIETSLTNSNGLESYRMPLSVYYKPPVPVKEKMHFVGIGIDKFQEQGHNLNYSVKDIRDLAIKLKEKYKENIVIDTLFNENVTTTNVRSLKLSLLKSGINDKVIVSYSGHGLLSKDYDYYLSTYSVNFKNPENGGLPYEMLESLMDSIPARKKLMLIDACHSGEVDKEEMQKYKTVQSQARPGLKGLDIENMDTTAKVGMKNSFELMQELFANVGRSTGATIISAAAGTQLAQERGDLKNGVFTYSILEFLKSHPSVSINALREYVNKRVPELTSGLQVPTTRTETNQADWEL